VTEIILAKDLTPETAADLEQRVLEAEKAGDRRVLAECVPQLEAYYAVLGWISAVQRALADWRIVHFELFKWADCASASQYFVQEAKGSAFAQALSTRLGNAHAIDFFYRRQGWTVEELTLAGIEKLRRWVSVAEDMAEQGGQLDDAFREVMLDPDVTVEAVPWRYQALTDGREVGHPSKGVRDEEWQPTVYSYSDPVYVGVSGEFFEIVAWIPRPGDTSIREVIGYVKADAEELWAKVLDREIQLKGR